MVGSNNIVRDTFDNDDVQSIIEREEDKNGNRILKCKICGVKFDNSDAFEGHIAAGHLSASNPYEDKPSGIGHLANTHYTCGVCGREFRTKEQYDTHRLQH
jgi:uncharacterized C2H2 Zn-finger protein